MKLKTNEDFDWEMHNRLLKDIYHCLEDIKRQRKIIYGEEPLEAINNNLVALLREIQSLKKERR